jgi:hypothetical protein
LTFEIKAKDNRNHPLAKMGPIMTKRILACGPALAFLAAPAYAADGGWHQPDWLVLIAVVAFAVFLLFVFGVIRNALASDKNAWSLADALSEEGEVSEGDATVKKMVASSSRLIAFFGLVVMLCFFIGFGLFVLYDFGADGKVPDSIGGVVKFLLAGLSLFAPYAANQVRAALEGFAILPNAAKPDGGTKT